jgi:2-dehydro-3-deoxygalactonokinase
MSAAGGGVLVGLDWGTTSLRPVLCDANGAVLDEHASARGILAVGEGSFAATFDEVVGPWLEQNLGAAVVASGMITSRNGWLETPYLEPPAGADELAAAVVPHELGDGRRIHFVTGLCCRSPQGVPDIMRGEETQICGCLATARADEGLFLLPGTHRKWARVAEGRITGCETFMTGEVYALLRAHSILGRLAADGGETLTDGFHRGVEARQASGDSLLHQLFSARTLALFDRLAATEVADYLSGLLIGEEIGSALQAGAERGANRVTIIGREDLAARYEKALGVLGLDSVTAPPGTTARGQLEIARLGGLIP